MLLLYWPCPLTISEAFQLPFELRLIGSRAALYDILRLIRRLRWNGPTIQISLPAAHKHPPVVTDRPKRFRVEKPLDPGDGRMVEFITSRKRFVHSSRELRKRFLPYASATARDGSPTREYKQFLLRYRRVIRFIERRDHVLFHRHAVRAVWFALPASADRKTIVAMMLKELA